MGQGVDPFFMSLRHGKCRLGVHSCSFDKLSASQRGKHLPAEHLGVASRYHHPVLGVGESSGEFLPSRYVLYLVQIDEWLFVWIKFLVGVKENAQFFCLERDQSLILEVDDEDVLDSCLPVFNPVLYVLI